MTALDDRPTDELETVAARLDETMAAIGALEPQARQAVNAALTSLDSLHRQALVTIVRRLREDPRGKELLFDLVDDPAVRMVLAMHEIIRPDPATSARQVLERVRPGLQSHGGDVELDRIEGTTAFVRLQGACNGCSMASVTMRGSVEQALLAGVPGLTGVEVLPNEPSQTVIPLSSLTVRPPEIGELVAAGWVHAVESGDVTTETVTSVLLQPEQGGTTSAVLIRRDGQVFAYVNECAHQALRLDSALVDETDGTLTCPWHGMSYDCTTGVCTTLPGLALQPLPVRELNGDVWVRPGGAG